MNTHADKTQENKSQSLANEISQKQSGGESTFQFVDNRPEAIVQRKLQAMADNYSTQQQNPIQKKAVAVTPASEAPTSEVVGKNNTGLPDNLKSGIENLSGYSMDDVKVHYNSNKPAQLQAHAYAQGADIHLGPGQEKHLPHETWHVVQQKQRRVKPTMQLKGKVNVNDDAFLEKEADVMAGQALQKKLSVIENRLVENPITQNRSKAIVQRVYLNKTTWAEATFDEFDSDTHVDTSDFNTEQEYEDLLADQSDKLAPTLIAAIQQECKTRQEEVVEEHWYKTAAHLGFEVEGLLTDKDFDISNSKWNKTLVSDEPLFHGTHRTPEETLGRPDGPDGTGFVSAALREKRAEGSQEVPPVKWRTGFDDIELASAVCLAKDVKGTAFFPLTGDDTTQEQRQLDDEKPIYLYAIRVPSGQQMVDTYGAQSSLEEYERSQEEERPSDQERLVYDPGYEIDEGANADCRWQFQEHAVTEVTPEQIVGVWRVERTRLIETALGGGERAGVRFRIHEESQFHPLLKPTQGSEAVAAKAKEIVGQYQQFYPTNEAHYLSYMGIIRHTDGTGKKPTTFEEAQSSVKPVISDVTNLQAPGQREDDQYIWDNPTPSEAMARGLYDKKK